MKNKVLRGSIVATMVLFVSGCGGLFDVGGNANNANGLIPPSAQGGNYAPITPPTYPPMPAYNQSPNLLSTQNTQRPQRVNTMVIDKVEISGVKDNEPKFDRDDSIISRRNNHEEALIPNSPMLTETNIIELNAVGMGIPPENTISPGQAMALAKRAAIVDAYRQIGEKMYGIRLNAQDTVKDMVVQNSTVRTKVQALIRNAEISESIWKDGVMQVSMQLKLDGRIWYKVLSGGR
ncbi:LPP20 family lipoprotein [Helicobacter himalayensis]|uniref:LPP20 family lipoprotein n=1 Tax=Helicobacter himalayensis TaxID=1591088 RepID=UPI0008323B05